MTDSDLPQWARAHGEPQGAAVMKRRPEDFVVEEVLDLEFSDDGEFEWLWVEKRGETTENVARKLARHAGVQSRQVSWSGLKDKHALTRQWFSVHMPGRSVPPSWDAASTPAVKVLESVRHRRKLRTGTHRRNRFAMTLRELDADPEAIRTRLETLRTRGAPNYFGEQRFGLGGENLATAMAWFAGTERPARRFQRGLYLSAARAFLFNKVLEARVKQGNWNSGIDGDVFVLRDSASVFTEAVTKAIITRLDSGDIHPTGVLWGKPGGLQPSGQAAALEESALAGQDLLCRGLIDKGMVADRRSLRMIPGSLDWETTGEDSLRLTFELPKGCFATALVRELVHLR